jgi:hypothetical protein
VTEQAILIAAGDLLPALKARLASEARDLLTFTDAEALRALEVITTRRPGLVLLERMFASTPRGAALMNRVRADPSLAQTRIRIVPDDDGSTALAGHDAVLSPATVVSVASAVDPAAAHKAAGAGAVATAEPATHLDYRGTRRSPRVRVGNSLDMLVDGNRGNVVDLSMHGAQLITNSVLKPNQRVRVALTDDAGTIRCVATVVWAAFEIPKGSSPRYRVGVEFIDPDTAAIEAYQQRHGQQ